MEQKKLSQLTGGEAFEGFVLIKALALKTGQTGKNYIDLTVCDDSSSMNAKIWDYNDHYAQFTVNSLVKVRGNVVVWQNTMQLRIERIRFATEADPVSINDFVPSAPFTGESMLADVLMYADRIENNDIRAIVHYVLEKYRDRLLYWPGGNGQPPFHSFGAAVSHADHAEKRRSAVRRLHAPESRLGLRRRDPARY